MIVRRSCKKLYQNNIAETLSEIDNILWLIGEKEVDKKVLLCVKALLKFTLYVKSEKKKKKKNNPRSIYTVYGLQTNIMNTFRVRVRLLIKKLNNMSSLFHIKDRNSTQCFIQHNASSLMLAVELSKTMRLNEF